MTRALCTDLRKSVCSLQFAGAAAVYLILLLSTVGTVGDRVNSPQLSLVQMLLQPQNARWLSVDEYAWFRVWARVIHGNYHGIMLAAIAAVPAAVPLCDELVSGNYRFTVPRIGHRKWAAAKWCSAMIGAVAAVLPGLVISAMLCAALLPGESADFAMRLSEPCPDDAAVLCYLLKSCAYLPAFCAVSALCAMTVSACLLNAYSAICLPTVVQFLGKQLAWRKYYEDSAAVRLRILDADALLNPEIWLPEAFGVPDSTVLLAVYILTAAVLFCVFRAVTGRRLRQ